MGPTDILMGEHRVIEQVLDCLEQIAVQAQTGATLDAPSARDAIAFFRGFADRCHHGKEEEKLFPAMEAKGFPHETGPLAVMRAEHDEGRAQVRAMDSALGGVAQGQPEALEAFARHAHAFIALLRQHIHKEDHCLFAMADNAFSDADRQRLMREFGQVEQEDMGAGTHEHFVQIADSLAQRFGARKAPPQSAACCCHHKSQSEE